MKDLNDKVAVVTGSGSGIGRALALELAREGCNLALADINKENVDETAAMVKAQGRQARSYVVDVSKLAEMTSFADNVIKDYGRVDIVVNNAGVGLFGPFEGLSYEKLNWIVDINLWGVVYGSKEFLPYLKQQQEANIVNISSVAGLLGFGLSSGYCISKFAVRGLSESIRQELLGSPVTVTCVHPGFIDTNLFNVTELDGLPEGYDPSGFRKRFNDAMVTPPAKLAKTIIRKGIKKKKARVVAGSQAGLISVIARLFPGSYHKFLFENIAHKLIGKEDMNKYFR